MSANFSLSYIEGRILLYLQIPVYTGIVALVSWHLFHFSVAYECISASPLRFLLVIFVNHVFIYIQVLKISFCLLFWILVSVLFVANVSDAFKASDYRADAYSGFQKFYHLVDKKFCASPNFFSRWTSCSPRSDSSLLFTIWLWSTKFYSSPANFCNLWTRCPAKQKTFFEPWFFF